VRLLSAIFWPIRFLIRLLFRPLRLRAKKRALREHGWIELHLEGAIHEFRPVPKLPPFVRRFLRREDEPRVVMSRLRKLVDELSIDPFAKGALVRIGFLGGGWASAAQIRAELDRLKQAGKTVVVHITSHAGNREMYVASAGTHLLMTPSGAIASVGASSSTLFVKDTLEKIGVKVEVASKGRYKSAPEQFTQNRRTPADLEQAKAIIDEVDRELVQAIASGRGISEADAETLIGRAPVLGTRAKEYGYCDRLARDEDLPEALKEITGAEKPPKMVGGGGYLELRDVSPLIERKKKYVGIVEVHGAIADRGSPYAPYFGHLAVQKAVVNDLRAALEDREIGAVVLHVDSRGGSVTASDAIYSAVRRLNREKPVIACFGDVAASGGYYVACGARAIVCSPMTITGSIGVFAMLPTWPELGRWLGVYHDVIKNHPNAALYDPWNPISEHARAHAQGEVDLMYESFLEIVAEARKKTRDEIATLAEGRVWTGRAAEKNQLVDGLGGIEEAIRRAKDAAGGKFADDPVLVRSRRPHARPDPFAPKDGEDELAPEVQRATVLVRELAGLALTSTAPLRIVAYAPFTIE
jgi:protease IV